MRNVKAGTGAFSVMLLVAAGAGWAADPPKGPTVQNLMATARRWEGQKKWDEAAKACEQVIALPAATAAQKLEAFELLVDLYRRQKNYDQALATAVRIGTEITGSSEAKTRSLVLQGDLNLERGKGAEALAFYAAAAKQTDNPHVRQNCDLRIATMNAGQAHYDAALAAYERVFTDSPGVTDHWAEAQRGIVEALRKAGRPAEALQAARICFNSAADGNSIPANAQLIATILKEADKNVTRANAFLQFQQYGPAGKDGVAGTADDLADPLAAVGYPVYAEREKSFAQARAAAGDDAAASRFRALSYVYTGHPAEALQHFAETFRRSHSEPYPMLAIEQELIAVGVRGVRGHAVGLEKFYDFVRCGPAGPDGKLGTADDLKDPFSEVGLKPRVASDDGGLAPPKEAERKALVELRNALEMIAVAEREDTQFRQSVVLALGRVHTALCDWGTKGQVDWYLRLLPDAMNNEYEYSTVLQDGEAAARGCDLHFGGVVQFWREVDAENRDEKTGEKLKSWEQAVGRRNSFLGTLQLLEKPQSVAPILPLMQ